MTETEYEPILACTVCHDIQDFDLLIVDMEEVLGERWGDLGFADAMQFLNQPEADDLEFLAIAVDCEDESMISQVTEIVTLAKAKGVYTILIAEDVSPTTLHKLLRSGVGEFIPYPLPANELKQAVERMRSAKTEAAMPAAPQVVLDSNGGRKGKIFAVHGLAGGTGATTLAVNLAWELATVEKDEAPKVCLIDLDLQFGAVATYLDLPRREVVYEMLADTDSMDEESFAAALQLTEERLHVLTAPSDILPLDLIGSEDVKRILDTAARHFDFVVVDMPHTLVQWTETVLSESEIYFATMEIDMRSVQNTLRFKRALVSEGLAVDRLRFVLNHAPKFTDLNGKNRVKRISESLDIRIDVLLPDGGRPVAQGADHGQPLALSAPKNVLRKEIMKIATGLHQHSAGEKAA